MLTTFKTNRPPLNSAPSQCGNRQTLRGRNRDRQPRTLMRPHLEITWTEQVTKHVVTPAQRNAEDNFRSTETNGGAVDRTHAEAAGFFFYTCKCGERRELQPGLDPHLPGPPPTKDLNHFTPSFIPLCLVYRLRGKLKEEYTEYSNKGVIKHRIFLCTFRLACFILLYIYEC